MNAIIEYVSSAFVIIYEFFFGCRHHRQTRPFTLEAQTYKVCLDCGRQIYYSTERMTPLTSREIRRMKAAHAQSGILRVMPVTAAERTLIAEQPQKSTVAA